jgi:hypothetical protein
LAKAYGRDVKQTANKAKTAMRQGRRSACASKSLEAELERLAKMSVEEKINEALTIGRRFSWLKPAPVPKADLISSGK